MFVNEFVMFSSKPGKQLDCVDNLRELFGVTSESRKAIGLEYPCACFIPWTKILPFGIT